MVGECLTKAVTRWAETWWKSNKQCAYMREHSRQEEQGAKRPHSNQVLKKHPEASMAAERGWCERPGNDANPERTHGRCKSYSQSDRSYRNTEQCHPLTLGHWSSPAFGLWAPLPKAGWALSSPLSLSSNWEGQTPSVPGVPASTTSWGRCPLGAEVLKEGCRYAGWREVVSSLRLRFPPTSTPLSSTGSWRCTWG